MQTDGLDVGELVYKVVVRALGYGGTAWTEAYVSPLTVVSVGKNGTVACVSSCSLAGLFNGGSVQFENAADLFQTEKEAQEHADVLRKRT